MSSVEPKPAETMPLLNPGKPSSGRKNRSCAGSGPGGGGVWRPSRRHLFLPLVVITLTVLSLLRLHHIRSIERDNDTVDEGTQTGEPEGKVALTAFVMSKCPDAVYCENAMADVLAKVGSLVDFKTEFIAKINSSATYGATCMHGDDECRGNILELCTRKVYPDTNKWLNFTRCLNKKYWDIPDEGMTEDCAHENLGGPDALVDVTECMEGDAKIGQKLFLKSVKEAERLGVKKSCTIFINDEQRCIRDGGKWYDCPGGSSTEDFVKSICEAYQFAEGEDKPEVCAL
ncbi:hypothetical protein HK101_003142 [Irineochytrium annulatum]|nr:hypothetical protein HK101_003142 [Irineochytrium annulatum]